VKYFYDTEFIEDGKTIDLISIGIVCEDGRELYLESADFDKGKANQWVRENVLSHLKGGECRWSLRSIKVTLLDFFDIEEYGNPELWGYYSAYDHVVFCQIFGEMADLPEGYPMLTYDLRQMLDMKGLHDIRQPDDSIHNALEDARWVKQTWERFHG